MSEVEAGAKIELCSNMTGLSRRAPILDNTLPVRLRFR